MSQLVDLTGIKMLSWVSPIYDDSVYMQMLFEALGQEWTSMESLIADVKLQTNVVTATWGIGWWEDRVGLVRNTTLGYADRRALVLVQMQMQFSGNPKRMEDYLETIAGVLNATVLNYIQPYTFGVEITQDPGLPILNTKIVDVIERAKPAHLSYLIFFAIPAVTFTITTTITPSSMRLNRCGEIVCGTIPGPQIRNS